VKFALCEDKDIKTDRQRYRHMQTKDRRTYGVAQIKERSHWIICKSC